MEDGIFYVAKNGESDESVAHELMKPETLLKAAPDYYGPRFDAIAELRSMDDGTLHKGNDFRRVASFVNIPLFRAMSTVLDPDFMRDKAKFYKFLDENRAYCTYQRPSKSARAAQIMRDLGSLGKGK